MAETDRWPVTWVRWAAMQGAEGYAPAGTESA
jgi:hypothetical protein